MQSPASKPYVIIVGIDYSETGDQALAQAFKLANERDNAEPHVIHVAGSFGGALHIDLPEEARKVSIDEAIQHLRQHVADRLAAFQSRLQGGVNFRRVVTHQRVGDPAEEIAQLASDLSADLVVTGTHGRRGIARWALGSVAESVVRLASCPVLVARGHEPSKPEHAEPELELECSQCVLVRTRTSGGELWCEQHREAHPERNQYQFVSMSARSDRT